MGLSLWPTLRKLRNHSATLWKLANHSGYTEASPGHTVDIAISHAHRDTRRHSVYVSMAVQVPTVPSARARGASMHSMSLVVVDIVALRLSKASL